MAATAGLRVLGVRDGTGLLLDNRYRQSAQRGLAKP
jgi:hypothetical protein